MPWPGWSVIGVVVALAASGVAIPDADADAATDQTAIAVRELVVDVDAGIGGRFGGRVDVEVRFRVANAGGEPVQPTARIRVESQIGGGTTSTRIQLPSIAADGHVDVARRIGSVLPFGSVRVVVTVRTDERTTTATASTAVIPWFLLLALVVVVGVILAIRRARRS
jgi:hypothetical protein